MLVFRPLGLCFGKKFYRACTTVALETLLKLIVFSFFGQATIAGIPYLSSEGIEYKS
jgi:hypothetical protein